MEGQNSTFPILSGPYQMVEDPRKPRIIFLERLSVFGTVGSTRFKDSDGGEDGLRIIFLQLFQEKKQLKDGEKSVLV